jgi:ATP-dependent protease Clp ATPase subunit
MGDRISCSFCFQSQKELQNLIMHTNASIGDKQIKLLSDIITEGLILFSSSAPAADLKFQDSPKAYWEK